MTDIDEEVQLAHELCETIVETFKKNETGPSTALTALTQAMIAYMIALDIPADVGAHIVKKTYEEYVAFRKNKGKQSD